jgi:hypothetical protein
MRGGLWRFWLDNITFWKCNRLTTRLTAVKKKLPVEHIQHFFRTEPTLSKEAFAVVENVVASDIWKILVQDQNITSGSKEERAS